MASFFSATSMFAQQDVTMNPSDTLVLSLQDAVNIALTDNPTIQVADLSINKQRYANAQTAASLYPDVSISASYGYAIQKPIMYLAMPGMDEPMGIEMGRAHDLRGTAQATMPLVMPQLWQSVAMNKQQLEMSVEKSRSSKLSMVAEVRKAYMSALLADEAYMVFKKSYENALRNFKEIEDKFNVGLVAEYDVLRADVQVKNLEPNLIAAENGRILSLDRLRILLAIEHDRPIKLKEHLDDYADRVYETYLEADTSIEANSSLRQLAIQDTLAQGVLKIQKYAYIPTLAASINYGYSYMNDDFNLGQKMFWTPSSTVAVSLSIPIFSGGKRWYGVKESSTDLTMLRLAQGDTRRQISLAVKSKHLQLSTATRTYSASVDAVKSADRGYAIAEKRYQTGAGTLLELNDADVQLLQARLNVNQAVYDYMSALFDLDELTGRGIPVESR